MKRIVLPIFIALILAGCAVGPKYNRPELNAPTSYKQEPIKADSITNLKWWEVFQDTVLQGLIRISLNENRDLLTAIARVNESKAILGYNKANLLPSIDYNIRARATDFGQTAEGATVAFPTNSYSALGMVSWEIDLFGKLRHANRSAYAQLLASEEDRKAVYISLVSQVAQSYFQLRGLDERYELAKRTYASRQEYLKILILRFEKGQASELDKLQAEQITAAALSQVFALERQIVQTENALNVLLGRTGFTIKRGIINAEQQLPGEIPQGLPSQLLERRPDIRAAEQRLIAQTEQVGYSVALRIPTLSLTGFLGVASPDIASITAGDAFLGSVTGQLTGPIFRFNQNKRRVEGEKEIAKQYGYQYEMTVIKAFAEVESSLAEIRTYKNEYEARASQARATEKTLKLSKALYDNGYTSFLQVLDAERELYSAEYDKSVALQNQLNSTVVLYKALGGGW
ncbi:MAG TPA: efflux transporter outer membrane subunit [Cyclobacteriaceae bacterium]|nr:efflux transporter outer membrane subunit [Cyclobacteriaceae bacterium]